MQTFRYSPRPNRAHEIAWRGWSPESFAAAEDQDRPVLLCLTAVWCPWCRRLDETTFSDPDIIATANQHFLPIRVDVDRAPHVQDRYVAAGWPTTAFLTPTGEVLWAGTCVDVAEMRSVATSVLTAWRERREEFQMEIERRRRALDAARNRPDSHGLVRREAADDVLTAVRDADDPRNGGFGEAPKFPAASAVELLILQGAHGDPDCARSADRALDGMLAGELYDREEGGFFRYAFQADWTAPSIEKLLAANADLVRIYAYGARVRGRADWADAVTRTVHWVDATLGLDDGLWAGSELGEEEYYALAAEDRLRAPKPPIDATVLTTANAAWIAALAEGASCLGRTDWAEQAAGALDTLISTMSAQDGLLHHYRSPAEPPTLAILAADVLATGRAALAVAQATGDARWIAHATRLAGVLEHRFWAEEGGFHDRIRSPHDVGALRYRDRPFELNAEAARFLLDLMHATGERKYRALAERVLAGLSPLAGRRGVGGADFAIAVEDFFEPPLRVFTVGGRAETARLRAAAHRLAEPGRRVWPAANGLRLGAARLSTTADAAAFVCGTRGTSPPVTDPDRIQEAALGVR
jgi:hypothetical protein